METQHTPGPWTEPRVYKNPDGTPYCIKVYGNKGKTTVHHCRANGKELVAEANARLIAAAPDLLEIVRSIGCNQVSHIIWDKIERVIARAEGRE